MQWIDSTDNMKNNNKCFYISKMRFQVLVLSNPDKGEQTFGIYFLNIITKPLTKHLLVIILLVAKRKKQRQKFIKSKKRVSFFSLINLELRGQCDNIAMSTLWANHMKHLFQIKIFSLTFFVNALIRFHRNF